MGWALLDFYGKYRMTGTTLLHHGDYWVSYSSVRLSVMTCPSG